MNLAIASAKAEEETAVANIHPGTRSMISFVPPGAGVEIKGVLQTSDSNSTFGKPSYREESTNASARAIQG